MYSKNLKKIFALGDSSFLTVTEDNYKTFSIALKFYWRKYHVIICVKKQNVSIIMPPLTSILLTWHWQYRLSRSERKPLKECFCFSTLSWLTADSLKWCWTPTFAAHHRPRLTNRGDSCVWITVWIADDRLCESFWTSDHDVNESLTSGCCHDGSPFLCELHFGYNLLYLRSFFMDFWQFCCPQKQKVLHTVISRTVGSVAPSLCSQPSEPFRVCVRWAV